MCHHYPNLNLHCMCSCCSNLRSIRPLIRTKGRCERGSQGFSFIGMPETKQDKRQTRKCTCTVMHTSKDREYSMHYANCCSLIHPHVCESEDSPDLAIVNPAGSGILSHVRITNDSTQLLVLSAITLLSDNKIALLQLIIVMQTALRVEAQQLFCQAG